MKESQVITTTAGRVREAAKSCGTASEVLKKVFPEAFEEEWTLVPINRIKAKAHDHGSHGFDIHIHLDEDTISLGYISLKNGSVSVNIIDSKHYKVEVNKDPILDGAITFQLYAAGVTK